MGAVYLAQLVAGEAFSKWVAIKVVHPEVAVDPEFVRMFTDEARIAALIDHPNVSHVFASASIGACCTWRWSTSTASRWG